MILVPAEGPRSDIRWDVDDPCPRPPMSSPPANRGIVAGSYLVACLVGGIGVGALLGALVGAVALGIVLGVFLGFFAGIAVVRSRFSDL